MAPLKALVPDTAEYHRSFAAYTRRVTEPGMPWYQEDVERDYEKRSTYPALQLRPDGLKPIRIRAQKKGQDFRRHATAWERIYSPLCGGSGTEPVVDDTHSVVGHVGWFSEHRIFVQRGVGAIDANNDGIYERWRAINETIEQHGSVRVGMTRSIGNDSIAIINPDPHSGVPYRHGGAYDFYLLTDTSGTVLLQVDQRSSDFALPSLLDPSLLLGIGRLVVVIGSKLGRVLIRRLGAKASEVAGGAAARGAARTTSRGMGAVGPGSGVGAPGGIRPRVGDGGRLELTVDEMGNYLAPTFRSNPEFARLMQARTLGGDPLTREVRGTLDDWASRTGKQVEIVPPGHVQKLTEPGNFASMQGNKLIIERQVLDQPRQFYDEVVHELASAALGGRGVPHIWIAGNNAWNAQKILEMWIGRTGSFDWFRQFLGGVAP